MKVDVNTVGSKTNMDMGEAVDFRVENSPQMFSILSDNLYENKVGSMIRELSSNAVDAHVMAGEPLKPFTIHVPNTWEPWFSIKDEGVGLSHEDMKTVYTGYGVSTKQGTNNQIGGFGLGSKTPFAVTSQFTVTSIHGGMKRHYIVLNDGGGPKLNLITEEPTKEHPGVTVQIGVEPDQFSRYSRELREQLRFFPVKPILENDHEEIHRAWFDPDANVEKKTDLVTIYNSGALHGCYVVIGGVGYLLRVDNLDTTDDIRQIAALLASTGAAMHFKIGSIDPTANREGIQYTDKTRKAIIKRLEDIAETIGGEYIAEAKKIDTDWELCVWFGNLSDSARTFVSAHKKFDKVFANINIVNRQARIVPHGFPTRKVKVENAFGKKETVTQSNYYLNYLARTQNYRSSGNRPARMRIRMDSALAPTEDMRVFVRDTKKQPIKRFNEWWVENDRPRVIMIEAASEDYGFTDKDVKTLSAALGDVEIHRISDLPIVKRSSPNAANYTRTKAYMFGPGVSIDSSRDWTKIIDPLSEVVPAVYIGMDRHILDGNKGLTNLVLMASRVGDLKHKVIAVNQRTLAMIEKNKGDGWISVEEAAVDILKGKKYLASVHNNLLKYKAFYESLSVPGCGMYKPHFHEMNLESNSPINDILRAQRIVGKRIRQLQESVNDQRYIVEYFWHYDDSVTKVTNDEIEKCRQKGIALTEAAGYEYPLLKHIRLNFSFDRTEVDREIEAYVQQKDKARAGG